MKAVSGTQTHEVSAPSGQSIVAFKGQTQNVALAGGGYAWVMTEIDGVFG